jgi:formylglycine-generating enzyme required for sulfatase activity
MVVVPAGSFMMGSPEDEDGRGKNEGPQHPVTIAEPFAIGVYEVTFDEWDACVANGGCNGYRPNDRGWGRGRRPVIYVSWDDALTYVDWLSDETDEAYRLPSEAEWEYAARAGTTGPFHFGSTISTDQANFRGDETAGLGRIGVDRQQTVTVGSFPANAFGLHDVHGNVREWVADCWNDSYAGAPANGTALTSGDCGQRVLRGGSWSLTPRNLRSANRIGNVADDRYNSLGFRVARTLR